MWYKPWEVLLVDDEPDVLAVSKLAMRSFEVYGLPITIHTAASKAEAVTFLESRMGRAGGLDNSGLAVALIDVVMETDEAGLELCQYMREERDNRITQIYIRTGQPGIAPERSVIDRYDINGYFTKAEATEDKLYSLTKSGVRQHLSIITSLAVTAILRGTIMAGDSREQIAGILGRMLGSTNFTQPWDTTPEKDMAFVLDGQTVFSRLPDDLLHDKVARLSALDGMALGPGGDVYVRDADGFQAIRVAAKPGQSALDFVFDSGIVLPKFAVDNIYQGLASLAALWHHAR
jgi:CheY-like chemotaxis protein